MERLMVETVVYQPADVVYEFLLDFPGYANYSKYLESVKEIKAAATEQARYGLRFAWWKLTYTTRSAVTKTVPNERIEWSIIDKFDASGQWVVDEHETLPEDAPDWAETATTVRFEVSWNPHSVDDSTIDLPRFVSVDWVIKKVKPIVDKEAERIVRRAVADLEGRTRQVNLTVETEHLDTS
jgi:uncharacterized membrane protein